MRYFLTALLTSALFGNTPDSFILVTVPKSGTHLMLQGVLPILTQNAKIHFFHTFCPWKIDALLEREGPKKMLLLVRSPEDILYSLIKYRDKKARWGEAAPEMHQMRGHEISHWNSLTYEEKCLREITKIEKMLSNALLIHKKHAPFVVKYEHIKDPNMRRTLSAQIASYLDCLPLTPDTLSLIDSVVNIPHGWTYRKGITDEGKAKLTHDALDEIKVNPIYTSYKQYFGYD